MPAPPVIKIFSLKGDEIASYASLKVLSLKSISLLLLITLSHNQKYLYIIAEIML